MNFRQRVLKILKHEVPDYVPWFGDLDYYASALIKRGEKPDDFKLSDSYLDWHRELGIGFYLQGYFPFKTTYRNCEEKNYFEGNIRYHEFETPMGKIQEKYEYLPESYTEALLEHFVKTPNDLAVLKYVYSDAEYSADYSQAEMRKKQIGNDGINLVYVPKTPFMQLMVYDAGVMQLSELLIDNQDEVEELLEVMKASFDKAVDITMTTDCDAVMIPENLSAEMVGKVYFERYMKAVQKEWIEKIRKAGKYSFIHMDGSLRALLSEECSTGIDVLEALTPRPVGDLDISEFSKFAAENKTILWGGIPGSYFTPLVSDEEFENHIRKVLEVMKSEPRFVLGIADQAPPDTLDYRLKAVAPLVEKYGKF